MFDSILLTDQSIWLVIAAFYVADNVKRLRGNKLVFRETWRFGWKAAIPSKTLVILDRQLFLLPIFLPHVLTLEMNWFSDKTYDKARMRRADRLLRVAQRRAFSLRCISVLGFVAFFIAGPLLTYWRGIVFALLEISSIYIGLLLMLMLALFFDRRFWRLRPSQVIYAVAEAAVCPAYLANATHRISWRSLSPDVDGGAYGLFKCTGSRLREFKDALSFALEELKLETPDDPTQAKRLKTYSEAVLQKSFARQPDG